MKKPTKLLRGDTIAVVSLSSGVLGEEFASHQLKLAEKRLKDIFCLNVRYMDNSLRGIKYLSSHPEARANDLKQAMFDDTVKAIIVATGGNDTFKTIPYLMNDKEFINAVREKPKIFLGFSDTTNNHLMFYRLGMATFYGVDFLSDFGELDADMLSYTKTCFQDVFFGDDSDTEIRSSPEWYRKRTKYTKDQVGTSRGKEPEVFGFEVIHGGVIAKHVKGQLLGGCIESLYEMVAGERFEEQPLVTKKYDIFPRRHEWKGKILFLESSEAQSTPDKMQHMIDYLGEYIDYNNLEGVIVGKPQDNTYYEEYKSVWQKFAARYNVPVLYNVNYGHSYPHCILPYNATAKLDLAEKKLFLVSPLFST